jgi:hypothetical protein
MEIVYSLSEKLALAKARPDELHGQKRNARYMDEGMFSALIRNIKNRGELESLPFCGLGADGKTVEIISGHHRVRAAQQAGLPEIYILLDKTGLSPDRIKSKQLAHNSISGKDHEGILEEIYQEIRDTDAQLEAYIIASGDSLKNLMANVSMTDLNMGRYIPVILMFIENDKALMDEALKKMEVCVAADPGAEVYAFNKDEYESFKLICEQVKAAIKVRAMPFIMKNIAVLLAGMDEKEIRERLNIKDKIEQS